MNREEIIESINLKKRFCKDCNLPIAVFDNPYFEERLKTINPLHNCVKAFDLFCKELSKFNDEQSYFEYYNDVKDRAIEAIKSRDEFAEFNDMEVEKSDKEWPSRNLYVSQNDNCGFISIDMKKANFSAMRHYNPAIFLGAQTWEEFMRMFTDSEHIVNSKYIRQVICGACNPKRQVNYEHHLMEVLADHISLMLPTVDIYSVLSDEIIIQIPDSGCGFSLNELREAVASCPDGIGKLVRIELFDLHDIGCGWHKVLTDGDELKCVDAEIYHQVVKHMFNKKINKHDLVFYHNGQLAMFMKAVDNPWA